MLIALPTDQLDPHPDNRDFAQEGEKWREFVESVRRPGEIRIELVVRKVAGGRYQVVAGHRRRAAAVELGLSHVPCLVKELSDAEALELLVNENLQRADLTAVDEARFVLAMGRDLKLGSVEIAARLSRSVSWVVTRQGLLDLGDEVQAAVLLVGAGHLSIGAVEELLKVPEALREQAVQLVLHPQFQEEPLNGRQANEVLTKCLIEPQQREQAWEAMREPLAKAWRKALEKHCLKGTKRDLAVRGLGFREAASLPGTMVLAEQLVDPEECTPHAPEGLRWLHLAVKHCMQVTVAPVGAGDHDEGKAQVNAAILRQAEAAAAEHGAGEVWLQPKKRSKLQELADPAPLAAAQEGGRVEAALAVLEGKGEVDYQDEEAVETVITQRMSRWEMCNLGPVREILEYTGNHETTAEGLPVIPGHLPEWIDDLPPYQVALICNWVLSLKQGAVKSPAEPSTPPAA